MASGPDNRVILSFHESLLRKSDIHILEGPHWLNDTIISFYFEYLEKNVFTNHQYILFVSPEVTQCIKMANPSDLGIFLDPLEVKKREFVFFALNDNKCVEKVGGTHWSLLVYSRPENKFFHFDSYRGANYKQAQDISSKLGLAVGSLKKAVFEEHDSLQQDNLYDCGLYLISNAEHVAEHAKRNNSVYGVSRLNRQSVTYKRKDIIGIIRNLQEKS